MAEITLDEAVHYVESLPPDTRTEDNDLLTPLDARERQVFRIAQHLFERLDTGTNVTSSKNFRGWKATQGARLRVHPEADRQRRDSDGCGLRLGRFDQKDPDRWEKWLTRSTMFSSTR